jgi:hypothetical protein
MTDLITTLRALAGGLVPAVEEKAMRDAATADRTPHRRARRGEAEVLLWVKERCSWAELSDEIRSEDGATSRRTASD